MIPAIEPQPDALSSRGTNVSGLRFFSGYLDRDRQVALLAQVREIFSAAPLYTPRMPKTGRPMSVRMSNCGPLGWITDEAGYRYAPAHPVTGQPWPQMPQALLAIWNELGAYAHPPQACLINFY